MPLGEIRAAGIFQSPAPMSMATGARILFISGQVAQDADGNTVGKGDVEKQTEGVLQNIRSLIEVAGSGLADIARLAIFITEREHIEPVMAVRRRVLTPPYRQQPQSSLPVC